MAAENILFIFEGQKTEVRIHKLLCEAYFSDHPSRRVITAYNTNIYHLWLELSQDRDLDIVELVREKNPKNANALNGISRDEISQVYLFFDHEGHEPMATSEKLTEMLGLYNEETDLGRLYISYPMVEALRDIPSQEAFPDLVHSMDENIRYKQLVGERSAYNDLRKLDSRGWFDVLTSHLKKGNYMVNGAYEFDLHAMENIDQDILFQIQLEKYILPENQVAVLSGFPFFIGDYFGVGNLKMPE